MNILVCGAGAIGGTVGAHLSASHRVILVDSWEEHVATINTRGFVVARDGKETVFHPQATTYDAARETLGSLGVDLLILAEKAHRTDVTLEQALGLGVSPEVCISLQNGLPEERLASAFGVGKVLGEVTEFGAVLDAPGHITMTQAKAGFSIGELDGTLTPRVNEIAEALGLCAPVSISKNITGVIWSKLIWNSIINSTCAASGFGIGQLLAEEDLRSVAFTIGDEGIRVARSYHAVLEPLTNVGVDPRALGASAASRDEEIGRIVETYQKYPLRTPSMLQDIRRGRKTEVDYLNGAIVAKGLSSGVEAPANGAIVKLVHEIEAGDLSPSPEALRRLVQYT